MLFGRSRVRIPAPTKGFFLSKSTLKTTHMNWNINFSHAWDVKTIVLSSVTCFKPIESGCPIIIKKEPASAVEVVQEAEQ